MEPEALDSPGRASVVGRIWSARPPLLILVGLLAVLGGVVAFLFTLFGSQENFQTLRSELGRVHLPPQYRLTAQETTGTDCRNGCSIIQTWTWLPVGGRTASDQCGDASRALRSAFSNAGPDSPLPSTVCAYQGSDPGFHRGGPFIEATVTRRSAGSAPGFVIQLSANS